jgi:hypothetical protein
MISSIIIEINLCVVFGLLLTLKNELILDMQSGRDVPTFLCDFGTRLPHYSVSGLCLP